MGRSQIPCSSLKTHYRVIRFAVTWRFSMLCIPIRVLQVPESTMECVCVALRVNRQSTCRHERKPVYNDRMRIRCRGSQHSLPVSGLVRLVQVAMHSQQLRPWHRQHNRQGARRGHFHIPAHFQMKETTTCCETDCCASSR